MISSVDAVVEHSSIHLPRLKKLSSFESSSSMNVRCLNRGSLKL